MSSRDVPPLRLFGDLAQDVRYALRQLARSRRFAIVAVVTLTLGIGANLAIFTVADIVLLRPAPYPHPHRLVEIDDVYQGRASGIGQDEFREWSADADLFEGLALAELDSAMLRMAGQVDPERIVGNRVSDSFFDVLGAKPLYGRTFLTGEDLSGRARVIVLSHALWRRSFGGDADVIGTTVTLGEAGYEVIGVMPASFFWTQSRRAEFWRPLGYRSSGRMQHQYSAVGRLKPAVSLESAQAQMDVFAQRAEAQYPSTKGWRIRVRPLGYAASAESRTPLLALTVAAGLLLLIACANVASLLTVRTVSRSREIAVRASLGATHGRLVRQLLVEGGLLASIGGGLGVVLANWMIRTLAALLAPGIALPQSTAYDARGLGFSVALTALTTLVFGLIPAWQTIRLDPVRAIRSDAAGATIGPTRQRFLRHMVVSEVALATVLLITATLLITSLARLISRDLGFQPEHVLTFDLQVSSSRYDRERRVAFFHGLVERLNALPGIDEAAATSALPMSGVYSGSGFDIAGKPSPAEWRQQSAQHCVVTAGYFRTMRIAVRSGRDFAASEPAPVAVISETLARRHWPNEDPVGRRIADRGSDRWMTIVGVVADTRYGGPARDPNPTIYVSHDVTTSMSSMFVAVRLEPATAPILSLIRQAVRDMDPLVVVTRVTMMDDLTGRSLAIERSLATLLSAFAVFAVSLAAIGLYGVIAHSVQQRTHEMSIRLALGAEPTQVRNMVLWHGAHTAMVGIACGIAVALGLTRFIASYLFGATAHDPLVFTIMPLLLIVLAIFCVWLPAERAAQVDAAVALRSE